MGSRPLLHFNYHLCKSQHVFLKWFSLCWLQPPSTLKELEKHLLLDRWDHPSTLSTLKVRWLLLAGWIPHIIVVQVIWLSVSLGIASCSTKVSRKVQDISKCGDH